ncbi:G-box-binding factor 1-like [Phragmites australis]|uniref:G-box-binding factor 1-like n=1 Tax=Phragmites australis TaxID=29695 RepID=UPI002D77A8A6|nr:G-box-binding factor 1-like [Phragmites australis]
MSDDQHSGDEDQRQCRRGITVDVELGAALALADMAGVGLGPAAKQAQPAVQLRTAGAEQMTDEEMENTRLSLELGMAGIHSSSCSSSSSSGRPPPQAAAPGTYGPRPRHMLTEAEKEAKRLCRVLANRESARQTILRRQAIRDELERKVADLSSQNETMKKEKDMVMKEYLSLKETNKQLKARQAAHHRSLSLF